MSTMTRRRFVRSGLAAGAGFCLPWAASSPAQAADGGRLTKYVQPLPRPGAGIVVATPSAPSASSSATAR